MIRTWLKCLTSSAALILVLIAGSRAAVAGDAYIVGGFSPVPQTPGTGSGAWTSIITLFNTGDQPATGRLLSLSNGAVANAPADATFPPNTLRGFPGSWEPSPSLPRLFVYHVDLPSTVIVSDRLFFYREENCGAPACGPFFRGAVPLPVFRSLVSPGTPQILLNADLGDSGEVRANVAVFNGSEEPATARTDVHFGCSGAIESSQTVIVSPNSIIQVNAFGSISGVETCDPFDLEHPAVGSRYVTVVMDQPGFAILAALKDGTVDFSIPVGISP